MDSLLAIASSNLEYILGTLLAGVIIATVVHYKASFAVWKQQGVKGPTPWPFIGNMHQILLQNPLDTDPYEIRTYGKVCGKYLGTIPTLVVADPKLIKKILVKDFNSFNNRDAIRQVHPVVQKFLTAVEDDEWKRQRMTITPTFTSGKIKYMFGFMNKCVQSVLRELNKACETKSDINVKHVTGCYTMDVIAKCCFATDTDSAVDEKSSIFVSFAKNFFNFNRKRLAAAFLLPKFVNKYFQIEIIPEDGMEFFANVSKALIEQRKQDGFSSGTKVTKDFLQLLLEAGRVQESKSESETTLDKESHHGYEDKQTTSQILNDKSLKTNFLPDDEIVANSILFFAAGYETTGSLLTYTLYALATNPEVQEKLHAEVETIADNLNYETISKLDYLDAVISESLRFYCPVPRITRVATKDYWLNGDDGNSQTGIFVPRGTGIIIPASAIHKLPEYWNTPEKFDPERFLPENRSKIIPYSYLPFGAGPRNCGGMRFALLEAKLALVSIVLYFKLVMSPRSERPLDFSTSWLLLVANSVTLGVEKRK